jgi:predicted nucleic acid-binding protein
MRVLVDTNVLLRIAKPDHADHRPALEAVQWLRVRSHSCVMAPQGGYEYYVVATRPVVNNGLGLAPEEAVQDLMDLLALFHLLRDERAVFDHWIGLLLPCAVRGRTAHDARLVAAMKRHEIVYLLTFNGADFARYPGISVLDPRNVAAGTAGM